MPIGLPLIKAIPHSLLYLTLLVNLTVSAFAAPGDRDLTFGTKGKVVANFFYSDHAFDMALQPDGKFVVVGTMTHDQFDDEDFLVARFHPNGELDTSFGNAGRTSFDISGGVDFANAVALQADGKIVVCGSTRPSGASEFANRFVVVRYHSNGSLDAGFGDGGKVLTDFFGFLNRANAVVVQPDGKLVVAGFATQVPSPDGADFALARYNADGSLDTTFGSGGKVVTSFSNFPDIIEALALQPDGKIIAGGTLRLDNNFYRGDFALTRYNPDGTLDATFGEGGMVITDVTASDTLIDQIKDLALEPDGKIIAGGSAVSLIFSGDKFAMARYQPDGTLDASFGAGGKVSTVFNVRSGASGVARQANGKIILAGAVVLPGNDFSDVALARYNSDGTLDATFGNAGRKVDNLTENGSDGAAAIALQPDGRIVIAGISGNAAQSYDFLLARYLGDGIAPEVVNVVSRKVHGGSGPFDIDLLAVAPPRTECRIGGAGESYQLVVTFANPVTVAAVSVTSINNMATATQSVSGAIVTIDLAAVANAQTAEITLLGVDDGIRTGNVVVPFRVLLGDTTGDGSVTATDISQVKSQSGQTVTASNFRTDVNATGSINASDLGLVKSKSGTQLP